MTQAPSNRVAKAPGAGRMRPAPVAVRPDSRVPTVARPVTVRIHRQNGKYLTVHARPDADQFELRFDDEPTPRKLPNHIIRVRHTKPIEQTLSLFDEEDHPRADESHDEFNPETGKTIRGGQFRPKPKEQTEETDELTEPMGDQIPGASHGVSPADGRRARARRRAKRDGGETGGPGDQLLFDTDQPGSGAPSGPGGGDARVHSTAGGERPAEPDPESISDPVTRDAAEAIDADADAIAAGRQLVSNAKSGNNYRITAADTLGEVGQRQRYTDNIHAVSLLKQLTQEERNATPAEQEILAKFSGWGAIPQAFDPLNRDWRDEYIELRKLLTPDEYLAARNATANSHFTSREVAQAMWDAVRRMGFEGGRILEPSCGVGNFLGLMPADIYAASAVTGIELDTITAGIAAQLYQTADVRNCGFQDANLPDNFYDLAISNVPFLEKANVYDPAFDNPKRRFLTQSLHNYFFAKALDKVRPGGVVAFITSAYTMDGRVAERVREYLAGKAELLGAIRLPQTTFRRNAGTDVTTDIIFLRKREESEPPGGESWRSIGFVSGDEERIDRDIRGDDVKVTAPGQIPLNEYFVSHPEQMLGTMARRQAGPYGSMRAVLDPRKDVQLADALPAALLALPAGVYAPPTTDACAPDAPPVAQLSRIGRFEVQDGHIVIGTANGFEPWTARDARSEARIRAFVPMRDSWRELQHMQASISTTDDELDLARGRLNADYDAFRSKFGYLNDRANARAFAEDPDGPGALALEKWNKETQTGEKASIFSMRTVMPSRAASHAADAKDAMMIALSEKGRLDFDHMASLTGKPAQMLQQSLVAQGLAYENPEGGWQTADEYLSGDVRAKLKLAEGASANDARFAPNAAALRAVQPPDLVPEDIGTQLGAPWVPSHIVQEFGLHLLDAYASSNGSPVEVTYLPATAQWKVEVPGSYERRSVPNLRKWGTESMPAHEILERLLNQQDVKVMDRGKVDPVATAAAKEKAEAIADEFKSWLWADPDRSRVMARTYNDTMNNLRKREFDGHHLTMPGMSEEFRARLRPHVKDAVWRICQTPNCLIDHVVGAGKTAVAAGAAIEMRRLGICRKPLFAVPKHLVGQWASEIQTMYPGAHVLMTRPEDFEQANRKQLMAKIATGDWDAVLVSHEQFAKIALTKETEKAFYDEYVADIKQAMDDVVTGSSEDLNKAAKSKNSTVKDSAKAILRAGERLKKRMAIKGRDESIPFEELGVDQMFVDEAHLFKNLYFPRHMDRVTGLPSAHSDRAYDMYLKTRWLQKRNNGRGITFLTGTPVSNSIAELFVMQKYLQGDDLAKRGLGSFDAWAANFGHKVTTFEQTPDGRGYKARTSFSRFINVPELAKLYGQVADVKTREDLHLPVPKVERVMVACQPSPEQIAYTRQLGDRAAAVLGENGRKRPSLSEDNMLKITSDGRKAALDIRLVLPHAPEAPNSKVWQCAANVAKEYRESTPRKGTQTVFLDLSVPKTTDEAAQTADAGDASQPGPLLETAQEQHELDSVYQDLRRKLIAQGIPAKEIAFIHDAKTDAQKLGVFSDMNSGKLRVLIGSTTRMGTGMNAQQRMVALHHVDCPWRPADLEQREGRIIRQGNTNDNVRIYSYATAGQPSEDPSQPDAMSMDTYMYQTCERKARGIMQIRSGKTDDREVDDADMVLTAAEMKALASGNPLIKEKMELDAEARRMQRLRLAHDRSQFEARAEITRLPDTLKALDKELATYRAVDMWREAHTQPTFAMRVLDSEYTEPGKAGQALMDAAQKAVHDKAHPLVSSPVKIGTFKGFDLLVGVRHASVTVGSQSADAPFCRLSMRGQDVGDVALSTSGAGMVARLDNAIDTSKAANAAQARRSDAQKRVKQLEAEVRPFPHAEKLRAMNERLLAINRSLGIGTDEGAAQATGDDAESEEPLQKALSAGQPHPMGYQPSSEDDRRLARARGVVVPPASWGLHVSEDPHSRVQARWRDAAGRQQYGYHPDAVRERDAHKYGGLASFASHVAHLRRTVRQDLQLPDAEHRRACAAAVAMMDRGALRVGSEEYAREHQTYGATSLRKEHAVVSPSHIHLKFKGKHGASWDRSIPGSDLAAAVGHMQTLPGDHLLQYRGADGELRPLNEQHVRAYLRPHHIIPKQFRTYHGTRVAAEYLRDVGQADSPVAAEKHISAAIKAASNHLGNTPAVARSSYVNPAVLDAYRKGHMADVPVYKALLPHASERWYRGLLRHVGQWLYDGKVSDDDDADFAGVRKAIAFNLQTGETRGSVNPSTHLNWARAGGYHGRAMAPILRAASGVQHLSSRFQRTYNVGPSGAASGAGQYSHVFKSAIPYVTAGAMASRLSATHDVSDVHTTHTVEHGIRVAHHTFTAVPRDGGASHTITINSRVPPQAGPAARSTAPVRITRPTSPRVRVSRPEAPPRNGTDAILGAAAQLSATHYSSSHQDAARGMFGLGKREAIDSHIFTHRKPLATARALLARLQQTGHEVSPIAQRHIYTQNGAIRHQYSFEARSPSGERHTISVLRAKTSGH